MALRRGLLILLGLAAACHPSVRGRCSIDTDCRSGSSCTSDGLCVNQPPPSVQVLVEAGKILSPSMPRIQVRVTASPQLALGALSVVASSDRILASGTLPVAAVGDNTVTLAHFEPDAVGQVTVTATLQFSEPGAAPQSVSSDPGIMAIDTQPPSVNVFIPATSDTVNGWVARTAGTLEVQAQVDDGAGSGAASATLVLDHCPSIVPCSYAGAVVERPSAGAAAFSFTVPRAVQVAGSEAPVTGVIVAQDQAQNATRKVVSLQIDDAPPALGPVALVKAGVRGEDGHSWFIGGPLAAAVEISVAASDHGAGLLDLSLHLNPADVAPGTADPVRSLAADGSFHFWLPASAVVGREGALRFSLSAHDALNNAALLPESPVTSVWIDDLPPVVTVASVDYGSTMPAQVAVCSPNSNVICGRDATHVLRDDSATVTFDSYDCGAGLAAAGGATINGLAASLASISGSPCATSGNSIHHYTLQLDISSQVPGAPDPSNGNETLSLNSDAVDLAAHHKINPNGSALISIVRWRSQLLAGAAPSGSPALLPLLPLPPGSTIVPRQVVISTIGSGTSNLFILDPQGGLVQKAAVGRISNDVAVDKAGVIYGVGIDSVSSPSKLSIFDSTITQPVPFIPCDVPDATIGVPPAIAGFPDSPLAVLAATNINGVHNVYVFNKKPNCTLLDQELLALATETTFTGVSAYENSIFFAHPSGFSSISFNAVKPGFDQTSAASYSVSSGPTPAARGGPAIGIFPETPFFAGTDRRVHKTQAATCTGQQPCWKEPLSPSPAAAAPLNGTPVFDSNAIYATDANGVVYAFAQTDGHLFAPGVAPINGSTAIAVSSPVLVGVNQVLVVQRDATVRLLTPALPSPSNALNLLQMKSQAGAVASYPASVLLPPTPVVDVRGTGGVAYIPDGTGWVWAVQLDQAPVAASPTAWPRPGRDTCNSRNASASYCP